MGLTTFVVCAGSGNEFVSWSSVLNPTIVTQIDPVYPDNFDLVGKSPSLKLNNTDDYNTCVFSLRNGQ